jgi:hypothetical protein
MLNYQNTEFKSLEQLRETTPSIFTKTSSESTSDKYTHIPTDTVIRDLELLGWGVVDAKEVKARKDTTKGFQKHLVVLRNPDVVIDGADGDTVYPSILLTNSHDGKNSFKFQASIFRMICENGLVVSDKDFEAFSIRHMNYDFEELQLNIKELIERLPLTVESMNKMTNTQLTEDSILEMANKMLEIRIEGSKNSPTPTSISQILNSQRSEDKGNNVWVTFNRIQENIMEGNFNYLTPSGKVRQARPIKNFKQDMDLNKKMWEVAESFC